MTGKERLEKIILSMDLKKELHQKVFDNYEEMLRCVVSCSSVFYR